MELVYHIWILKILNYVFFNRILFMPNNLRMLGKARWPRPFLNDPFHPIHLVKTWFVNLMGVKKR